MEFIHFSEKAREVVQQYVNKSNRTLHQMVKIEDVALVWYAKVLKNWKAIVITNLPDSTIYEVTYSGEKNDICVDEYTKAGSTFYAVE